MANICNSWKGVGRFVYDHELKYGGADNNTAILRNTLAIDRKQGKADKDAGREKHTDFIKLVFIGTGAEVMAKYTKKGSKVLVDGEIHTGSYEKDGVKHNTFEVFVNGFEFLDSKNDAPIAKPIGADGFVSVADGVEEELPFI